MLIINAVTIGFNARFIKKKNNLINHIQQKWAQLPPLMSIHYNLYVCEVWLFFLQLQSWANLYWILCTCYNSLRDHVTIYGFSSPHNIIQRSPNLSCLWKDQFCCVVTLIIFIVGDKQLDDIWERCCYQQPPSEWSAPVQRTAGRGRWTRQMALFRICQVFKGT